MPSRAQTQKSVTKARQSTLRSSTNQIESGETLSQKGMRVHSCPWSGCGSSFSRKTDLQRHDRTHTQSRPHKCEWPGCNKAFNQKGQLQTHKNTHTGDRPHQCETCFKKFGDPASRSRHQKEAHGDNLTHQCPKCTSRIKRLASFQLHLRVKHGIDWPVLPPQEQRPIIMSRVRRTAQGGDLESAVDVVGTGWQDPTYIAPAFENSFRSQVADRRPAYPCPGGNGSFMTRMQLSRASYENRIAEIGSSSPPLHVWHRDTQLATSRFGPAPLSRPRSTMSSSDSPHPAVLRQFTSCSPIPSHYASMASSSPSSPQGFLPMHSLGESTQWNQQPPRVRRQLMVSERHAGSWHLDARSKEDVPIDPVLLSMDHTQLSNRAS